LGNGGCRWVVRSKGEGSFMEQREGKHMERAPVEDEGVGW
jgi:hypothetical protein